VTLFIANSLAGPIFTIVMKFFSKGNFIQANIHHFTKTDTELTGFSIADCKKACAMGKEVLKFL
jgi:hypothetical protein